METRPSYGGFDEPLDTAEKLLTEQAECAVTKAKLAEAMKLIRQFRRLIIGREIVTGWDDGGRQVAIDDQIFDEIVEDCDLILEGADERNSNLS